MSLSVLLEAMKELLAPPKEALFYFRMLPEAPLKLTSPQ